MKDNEKAMQETEQPAEKNEMQSEAISDEQMEKVAGGLGGHLDLDAFTYCTLCGTWNPVPDNMKFCGANVLALGVHKDKALYAPCVGCGERYGKIDHNEAYDRGIMQPPRRKH
jgi:hypothetical protein